MPDNPNAAARGMAHGILLGLVCWGAILFLLCGCTGEQIARADAALTKAQQHLQTTIDIIAVAEDAVAQAKAVAAARGSAEATAALAKAEAALGAARATLPAIEAVVAGAQSAAEQARTGAAWWQIGLSILGSVAGVAVPAVAKIRSATTALGRMTAVAETGVALAETLKNTSPGEATTRVLDLERRAQVAAGIRTDINAVRQRLGLKA